MIKETIFFINVMEFGCYCKLLKIYVLNLKKKLKQIVLINKLVIANQYAIQKS